MRKLRLGLFVAVLLGLTVGCGKTSETPAKVTGKVVYKGQPLRGGSIAFHPKEGAVYGTTLSEEGTYEIVGVPPVAMKVTIDTESLNPNKKPPSYGGGRGAKIDQEYRAKMQEMTGGNAGASPLMSKEEMARRYVKIPVKYTKPDTSGLSVTLEAGSQSHDFTLGD